MKKGLGEQTPVRGAILVILEERSCNRTCFGLTAVTPEDHLHHLVWLVRFQDEFACLLLKNSVTANQSERDGKFQAFRLRTGQLHQKPFELLHIKLKL